MLSLTTAWVWIQDIVCEKVASDLELGGGFHWVLWFPPPLTTGLSQVRCNMAEKGGETSVVAFSGHNIAFQTNLFPISSCPPKFQLVLKMVILHENCMIGLKMYLPRKISTLNFFHPPNSQST